ncbi:MAG: ATP-binding protein [Deltaproteobacteria bacterium]|nr:ATP-binding protein [Deltaproteobacteria bacterium]
MDIRFSPHNTHLDDPLTYHLRDPHLKRLNKQSLIHHSYLLKELPYNKPGIFTVSGGRQTGKTTLMKQWMALLLKKAVAPERIAYLTGELIDDHHALLRLIEETLNAMPQNTFRYLILDEATYIKDWDKGVKYMADAGLLENTALFLTGSDLAFIKEARMRFPGRRGTQATVDFHLYPLSLYETIRLKQRIKPDDLENLLNAEAPANTKVIDALYEAFYDYLAHGGFLTAMNDLEEQNRISPSTFTTYSDWIRGDVLKRGKQDHYLREILQSIVKRYGTQTTWNSLAQDLSIDHPKTVGDYMELLSTMDAVFIQPALLEEKLTGAPKKARKVMFTDPFIFHAVRSWLSPVPDPHRQQMLPLVKDPEWTGRLVEAVLVTHYRRYYPTFYIKAQGEVDLAYIDQGRFWPVEVKWTGQIRPKDLKQIAKYKNGRILTKSKSFSYILNIPTEPLPIAMLRLGAEKAGIIP